jgi:hypothetical protein
LKSNIVKHPSKSSTAYATIYRITGGFLYAATSNLKRLTGKNFTMSKCFHRSKPKLLCSPKQSNKKLTSFDFLSMKTYQRMYRKY